MPPSPFTRVEIKPLSINAAFQGRRFKTPEYKAYEDEITLLLPKKVKMVKGDVELWLIFYIKNHKRSDLDNFFKPLIDILVKRGFIEDDRKIYRIVGEKVPCSNGNVISFFIRPYAQAQVE